VAGLLQETDVKLCVLPTAGSGRIFRNCKRQELQQKLQKLHRLSPGQQFAIYLNNMSKAAEAAAAVQYPK
jgi:hypothetical protein